MRRVFLPFAALSLVAGVAAGLSRLGWFGLPWAAMHGPLMVCGFLGGMIALERAVALERPWGYLSPGLAALGSSFLLAGSSSIAALVFSLSGLAFLAMHALFFKRQPALHTACMLAGSVAWYGGTMVWLASGAVFKAVPLWAAFPVLIIAGERMELSRFTRMPPWAAPAFAAAAGAILVGAAPIPELWAGGKVFGAGLLGLALWLAWFDQGLRRKEETEAGRFTRLCLAAGYSWLGAAAALVLWQGLPAAGEKADAVLHALFLGYVFAMILGHALIIFPALTGIPLRFHRGFSLALGLISASLLLRLAGDLGWGWEARRLGGLFNAAGILSFLMSVAWARHLAGKGRDSQG